MTADERSLTLRLAAAETALWLAEYRAEQLSGLLRGMARRCRVQAVLIADVTQALGYGRAANPEFLVDVAGRAGASYVADGDRVLATLRRAAGFTA